MAKLTELAKSIKASGVLTPIIVRRSVTANVQIAGERRVRASVGRPKRQLAPLFGQLIRDAYGSGFTENSAATI